MKIVNRQLDLEKSVIVVSDKANIQKIYYFFH